MVRFPLGAFERLREAEGFFATARYKDAAKAADAVWKVVVDSPPTATRFSVEVGENGPAFLTTAGLSVEKTNDRHGQLALPIVGERKEFID